MTIPENWFETWFNSPYYHVLYKNRDQEEAALFIRNMLEKINLPAGANFLDLACGKGRHSIQIHQQGYRVTGVDLSPENIAAASRHQTDGLNFDIRDMRHELGNQQFDAVVNMFTSFGYFPTDAENFSVFANIHKALKPNGIFVFDYLNCDYVLHKLTPAKDFLIDNIHFRTSKYVQDQSVIKQIDVEDGNLHLRFFEKVRLFTYKDLYQVLLESGFGELESFGNYHMEPYHIMESPRLIFIAQKIG